MGEAIRIPMVREDDWPNDIPGPPNARQAVVAQAAGELGQRIGIEWGKREHVGPAPQFDVRHRVAALVSAVGIANRPLVVISDDNIGISPGS